MRKEAARLVEALGLKPFYHRYLEWRTASRAAPDAPLTDDVGVPLPPPLLMSTVVGHADWRLFLSSGRRDLLAFKSAVERCGGDFASARRLLDFGCGCGRLARHLPSATSAEIFAVDSNRALADWCAYNLKGAFSRNAAQPPLDFPDAHFDILYALSVFTHQRRATQDAWLGEFARILAPGGFALITFHDEDHPAAAEIGLDRARIEREGFVIHNNAAEGSNFMATFQSRAQFRRQAEAQFEVCEIVPPGELAQTIGVLRRKAVGSRRKQG